MRSASRRTASTPSTSPVPGSMGTPASVAARRAASLSPMSAMLWLDGPMKVRPASSIRRTSPAFSAKKP